MKAMIFAAGLGTRLKPLTDHMPKALVPVAGKPLLEHILARLTSAGYDDITINVHHFADRIKDYLSDREYPGVTVHISDESCSLLETGGGILHARPYLDGPDGFLIHNVDILSNLDLRWFESECRKNPGALATLLVSERQTSRYLLFDDDMRLVGWTNVQTGEVRTPFAHPDLSGCRRYAFSGIHHMSGNVFGAMRSLGFDGRFPIMDFYLKAAADYPVYGTVCDGLKLVDVGKTDSLALAGKFLESLD